MQLTLAELKRGKIWGTKQARFFVDRFLYVPLWRIGLHD